MLKKTWEQENDKQWIRKVHYLRWKLSLISNFMGSYFDIYIYIISKDLKEKNVKGTNIL